MLLAGSRIGPYEIVANLGAGGMGEVYRARDPRLERWVAVKILISAHGATPEELARFEREARAIARVSHPNICAVYDVGQDGGVPFLVMELLEGETVAERLLRGRLPMDQAVATAIQIAEALAELHSNGVVHRDLKPSNVMLTPTGVKLLDFGLAKLRDGEFDDRISEATKSMRGSGPGAVLGTLPYMAPEQVEGRSADGRTDVFALGVVLYEMLTGQPPFRGTSQASLAAAILAHEPPPLSSQIQTIPLSLDRVVKKCLAKAADERWQSVNDLASALRWSADDGAVGRQAGTAIGRGHARTVTALATGFVVATLIAAVVWTVSGRRVGGASAVKPRFAPVTFRAGTVTAARFGPDGDSIIYSAAWGTEPYALFMTRRGSVESRRLEASQAKLLGVSATGDLAFLSGPQSALRLLQPGLGTLLRVSLTGGAPRELLDDVISADWLPGTNDLAIVRRGQVDFPSGTKIYGQHRFRFVRVSPDGQRLALLEAAGRDAEGKPVAAAIVLLDRSGRKSILSPGWGDVSSLAWSASGNEVWFSANRPDDFSDLALRGVTTDGKERVILPSPGAFISIHDIHSTGRVLMSTAATQMGSSCLAPGATQPREIGWLDGSAPEALSADGRLVLTGEVLRGKGAAGAIYLRRTDGSDAVRLGDGFPEDLSPDGKWVLAAPLGARDRWFILPSGPGFRKTLPNGSLVERFEANFLPDGRRIVFGGRERDKGRRIYVQDVGNGSVRAISPENSFTAGLATPDGRFVIGRRVAGAFMYPIDGGAPVPFPALAASDTELQWSADGRFLYVRRGGAWPPIVDRIDVATGRREVWRKIQPADPAGLDSVIRILVTPDGKTYCHDYVRFLSELFVVEGLT